MGGGPMIRRKALAEATVELTPLIDVVFLLLIFFMVSTSFIRETQLGVELASASGGPVHAGAVEITVYREGRYLVNGQPVAGDSLAALTAALAAATRDAPGREELPLLIAADAQSTHQSVVRALEAAGAAGLTRISMVTRQPDDAPSATIGVASPDAVPGADGGGPGAG